MSKYFLPILQQYKQSNAGAFLKNTSCQYSNIFKITFKYFQYFQKFKTMLENIFQILLANIALILAIFKAILPVLDKRCSIQIKLEEYYFATWVTLCKKHEFSHKYDCFKIIYIDDFFFFIT